MDHSIKKGCKRQSRNPPCDGTYKFSSGSHKRGFLAPCNFHENTGKKTCDIFPEHKNNDYQFGYEDGKKNSEEIHFWRLHHPSGARKRKLIIKTCQNAC